MPVDLALVSTGFVPLDSKFSEREPLAILVPGDHHWRGAGFSLNQERCLRPFRTLAGLLDGVNSNFHIYLSGLVLPNIPWIAQESLSSLEGIR